MKNKQKFRFLLVLSLILLVLLTTMQGFAGDGDSGAPSLRQLPPGQQPGPGVEKVAQVEDPLSPLAGERVWPTNPAPLILPSTPALESPEAGCTQLIVNTELDVVTVGGVSTAEPWVVLWNYVYFSTSIYVSPIHSLFLEIGDTGDPSPNYDGFGQAVNMPSHLTSVTAQYQRRIDFANGIDEVYGELWTVDNQGILDEYITGWIVSDSPAGWGPRMFTVSDGPTLSQLSGRTIALVLVNDTTDTSPGEVAYFDDITLTACFDPPDFASYLPATNYLSGTGPICNPPSESPPDGWYNDRGLVQTGANCNSTLSQLDDRDYYSYTPGQTGTHTVHLRNLPNGSNWAALVYNDTEPPPTGPTNGGTCYTAAPGSADKSVVCNFTAGQNYVIKVSVGSTPLTGSYNLQVTRP